MRINLVSILVWLLIVYICGCMFFTFKLNWSKTSDARAKVFSERSIFIVLEEYDGSLWVSNPAEHNYFAIKAWRKVL